MQALFEGLTEMGVPAGRIHYESFGPATVLRSEAPAPEQAAEDVTVPVRFVRADVTAEWSREHGTLLEFAESLGLAPQFNCRSGICGTCTTRILSGAVDYLEDPVAPRGAGELLLCCSVPHRGVEVILDL